MDVSKKKKKQYLVWVSVIIAVVLVGVVIYYFTAKSESSEQTKTENKEQTTERKVRHLQQQLNRIEEELNKPENFTEGVKFARRLILLKNELGGFFQLNSQQQEEFIHGLEDFIKKVEEELKNKNEPVSSIFKLNILGSKIGYWLFENKEQGFEVYIAKDHSFLKGKKLENSEDTPPFNIKFKKKNASRRERDKTFYFEKDDTNFELKPLGNWFNESKKELKITYIGEKVESPFHFGGYNYVFSYSSEGKEKYIHIYEKHPRIEELLNEGKLKKDNKFTIHYLREDCKTEKALFFKGDNENLEIVEI